MKEIIPLLNKVFHDEAMDCLNLKSMLEISIDKKQLNAKQSLLAMALIESLNGRIKINTFSNDVYYKLRDSLEKGD